MRYFRYVLVIVLIIVAFSLVSSRFRSSYHDIPALFKEAHQKPLWLLLVLEGVYLSTYALLSKTLLNIAGAKISLKETIKVGVLGVLGFQVAPFIGGAILVYLFYKKQHIPSSKILFLVTSLSILGLLNALIFSFASIILVHQSFLSIIPQKEILIILVVLFFLLSLGYFLLKNKAKNLVCLLCFLALPVNKIGRLVAQKEILSQEKIKRIIQELSRDFDLISTNWPKAVKALALSLLFYIINISLLYSAFFVFGFKANIPLLVLGFTLSAIVSILSLFPEAPGVMEASMVTVFIGLGFPAHISLFAALLYRLVCYWLPMPFGFLVYLGLNGYSPKDKKNIFEDNNS